MSQSTSMADLLKTAQDNGFGEVLPDGVYQLEVGNVKATARQGGGSKLGVMFRVVAGPQGGSTWNNVNLIPGGAGNGFFFELLNKLGVPNEHILQLAPSANDLSALAQHVLQVNAGKVYTVTLGNRTWGKDKDKKDNTFTFMEGGAAAAAPAPAQAAPVPVAAVAPVAVAPVAVAPVAVAPVAVAEAVAPAPVAPVAVAAVPEAVAPLPVAAVPVAPVAPVALDAATGLPPRPGGGI